MGATQQAVGPSLSERLAEQTSKPGRSKIPAEFLAWDGERMPCFWSRWQNNTKAGAAGVSRRIFKVFRLGDMLSFGRRCETPLMGSIVIASAWLRQHFLIVEIIIK